jgi:4-amino-4-deoxy-L-arabinose transferase-like glycosyltransferase
MRDSVQAKSGDKSPHSKVVPGLIVLVLCVRGGVLLAMRDSLALDPDAYRRLAVNLVEHGTFGHGEVSSAYRPPLYPLVLVPAVSIGRFAEIGIAVTHLLIGVATVLLVYHLGRRWGLGRLAVVAAALVACDPILLSQSTLVMTETLATLMAVAALWLLTLAAERPSWLRVAAAGAWIALASLCRPTFLVFMAVAAVVLPWPASAWPQRVKTLLAFSAAAAVVLAPWAIRNQIQFGKPILGTTHGGYTLLLGNNPSFYNYLRHGAWGTIWNPDDFFADWSAQLAHNGPPDELANDRLAYARARQTIDGQPGTFAYACLVRIGRLWSPLPHRIGDVESPARRGLRYAVAAWYAVEFALAAVGLMASFWVRRKRDREIGGEEDREMGSTTLPPLPISLSPYLPLFWGLLLAVCFTAVHTFYWTNMRMRAPLEPVVALAAVGGLAWIAARTNCCKAFSDKYLRI